MASTTENVAELQAGDKVISKDGWESTVRSVTKNSDNLFVVGYTNGMTEVYAQDDEVEVKLD